MKDTAIKAGTYCPVCRGVSGADCWHNATEFNVPRTDFNTLDKLSSAQAENAALKAELKAINAALDNPRTDLTMTACEVIFALREQVAQLKDALTPKPPRDDLVPHAYELEPTHNNAEFWYKAGHSEEARLKGKSVIFMAQAVFAWKNAAYAKAEEEMALRQQLTTLQSKSAALVDALEMLEFHDDPSIACIVKRALVAFKG